MKLKKFMLITLVAQGITLSAFADNRESYDVIFEEPAKSGGTQILLGVTEWIAAGYVSPDLLPEQVNIVEAEKRLKDAQSLITSEAERLTALNDIFSYKNRKLQITQPGYLGQGGARNYWRPNETPEGVLKPEAYKRYKQIISARIVTVAEKQAAIEAAEEAIEIAKVNAINVARNRSFADKLGRRIRVAGSLLLIVDAGARVLVWNAFDADPTYSPTITTLEHLITK